MPLDNRVTRLPYGVNNVFDNDVFNNLKLPDQSQYHFFYEDFDKYTAAQWSVGGVNPVAPVLAAGDGGVLAMATTGASGDSNFVQQAANAFSLTAGKKIFFRIRGTLDDATLGLLGAGLQVTVAGNNFLTPTEGLFLRKPAADTNLYLVYRNASVETLSIALGVLTSGTPFEAAFQFDGVNNVVGSLNGVTKASITLPALTAVVMRVTAGVQANSAVARTLTLDQLFAAKER